MLSWPIGLKVSAEFRGAEPHVAWDEKLEGRLWLLSAHRWHGEVAMTDANVGGVAAVATHRRGLARRGGRDRQYGSSRSCSKVKHSLLRAGGQCSITSLDRESVLRPERRDDARDAIRCEALRGRARLAAG